MSEDDTDSVWHDIEIEDETLHELFKYGLVKPVIVWRATKGFNKYLESVLRDAIED